MDVMCTDKKKSVSATDSPVERRACVQILWVPIILCAATNPEKKKKAFSCTCVGIITFMVRCSHDLRQTPVGVAV